MFKKNVLSLIAVSTLFIVTSSLYATTVPLVIFNNPTLAADPSLNFTVEAIDGGAGKVDFLIKNNSTMDSTIAQVYFDGGFLADIADIINGTGTDFSEGASPADLPSGTGIGFAADFSAGAEPPPSQKGIDPGESITVKFNLSDSHTLAEIIGQLNNGDLRVGAHIISIGPDEVSVSAVTPEPTTIALLGLGSIALLRKRSAK